ncbi:MAG: Asp-tRNA(Asn)/Glu-tRNA(Gln) amidotransferase subunit GatB [Trueperaceae bacterium]|nr:Asp-tRNA(Asn)/Glu-tRNA(Gln) amidotransferase subunit GatB [Trueperaceae bacterium]
MPDPVIGLEIHLAVATRSKMFCGCDAQGFGAAPNTHVCPVCMGLPGSLPVANREAIEKAIRLALALDCQVPARTQFHRKHYFYPDAPKNYQISQFDRPIGEHGVLHVPDGREIGITRCHLEEDAGRLVHPAYAGYSLVDLNRAGAPLIEMVTDPDVASPEEARAFLQEVRALARALGVSEASPEEGKMRADVNVSLRHQDGSFGTKVEVKNLNSFRSVEAALHFEIRRQERLIEDGSWVTQETRGWNEGGQKTVPLRTKEGSADYRYMPDPDLPEIHIDRAWLTRLRDTMPERPAEKRARYVALAVRAEDAATLAYDPAAAAAFDAVHAAFDGPAQTVANWLLSEVAGRVRQEGATLAEAELDPARLAALLSLVQDGTISNAAAKEILGEVMAGADPAALVEERGLARVADEDAIGELVDTVMAAHPAIVDSARQQPKAINALLGRVMKESGGTADPAVVRRLLEARIAQE